MSYNWIRLVAFVVLLSTVGQESLAQQYTKAEVGAGTESQTYSGGGGGRYLTTGSSGVVDYNLSPSLSIEGSIGYLPLFQKSPWQDYGAELLGLGGVKAGRRGKRFSVYGKIEPGFASFSCGLSYYGPPPALNPYTNCQRRTHFALQYGGVAEYNFSPRAALRLDATQMLVTEFDQVLARYEGGPENGAASFILDGHVAEHFDLRVMLQYRLGKLYDVESEPEPQQGRVDAGVLYALQPKVHLLEKNTQADNGTGVWLSWNVSRHFSWDTSVLYFPLDDHNIDYQDGGASFDSFSGIKAGFRRDRVGIFAKVRPGTIVFTRTFDSLLQTPEMLSLSHSKFVDYGLDTGGIVEVYPFRRVVLRAEAGEVSIFYPSKRIRVQNIPLSVPGLERSAVMTVFGLGYRF